MANPALDTERPDRAPEACHVMFCCRPIRTAALALALAAPVVVPVAPAFATTTTTVTAPATPGTPRTEVLGEILDRGGRPAVVADTSHRSTSAGRMMLLGAVLALALVAATGRVREYRRRRSYYF